MNADYYKKYEPVFNSWYLKKMLGEGSYGKVFEIEREDFGTTYKAALKTMTIPQSESEIKSVMADGMDEASVREYYENFVEDIVKEFVLMSKLKGNSNIVSYEDHQVIEHEDKIGWDILIRMELLTPLHDYIRTIDLKRKDVIKLGIDMCKALELCQKYNIIHRDIKPENIFVSENGDYKLGDFGIARTLEQTSGMLSKKGTQAYMAPEIYREEAYGSNVDIYSLGIVMYRLLNENRTPFLPAYPAPITHSDRESAVKKRISGAPIPKPSNADGRLAEIVLKACSYDPKDRYFSPMEMRGELEAILYNKEEAKIIYPKGDETPIKSIRYVNTGDEISQIGTGNRTEGMFGLKKSKDSASETEGMFGKKKDDSDKTESGFESKLNDDEKTEGMFGKKTVATKKKKSVWKNRIAYAVGGAVIVLLCIGGFFRLGNRTVTTVSGLVNSVAELKDPIEIKIVDEAILQSDYETMVKRLNAYGADFYIDKSSGMLALNRSDLGASDEEILAAVHMLTGEGRIKIDFKTGSENALGIDDIEEAFCGDDNNRTGLKIKLTVGGIEKINKTDEEIQPTEQESLMCLYVDDNLRCDNGVFEEANKEIVFESGYDEIKLSSNCIGLLASIINDGKLSKSYEAVIDEKYGINTDKITETEEPSDEAEQPEETVQNRSGYDNKRVNKPTETTPPEEEASVQAPEQPQEQAPAEQPQEQTVVTQTQQSSGSSNENNLPEFYMDFE